MMHKDKVLKRVLGQVKMIWVRFMIRLSYSLVLWTHPFCLCLAMIMWHGTQEQLILQVMLLMH